MNNTTNKPANAVAKTEHELQVEKDRVEAAKYFAANPTEALGSGAALASLQNVYMTNIPGQFEWGKGLTAAGAFALATAAASTGLNPLFGQILMLGGAVYLTEKGCHHISNTRPEFDGYELTPVPKSEYEELGFKPDEIAWKCLVFRKDRSRPTPGYGRASPANVSLPAVKTHWLSEMAQKRAIQRAMTRAFALPFGGADEAHEDLDATATVKNITPTAAHLPAGSRAEQVLGRLNAGTRGLSAREVLEQSPESVYTGAAEQEVETRQSSSRTAEAAPKISDADSFRIDELVAYAQRKGLGNDDFTRLLNSTTGSLVLRPEHIPAMIDALNDLPDAPEEA